MGLIRGIARTAVVAGTATAVSNRVSRRQQERWVAHDTAQAAPYQATQYQPAPSQPGSSEDLAATLDRLTDMRNQGQLTDEEFAAAKAKVLGI